MSRKQHRLAMALMSCIFISTTIDAKETNLLDDAYVGIGVGGFVLDSPSFVAGNGLVNLFVGYPLFSQLSAELSYERVAILSNSPAAVEPQFVTLSVLT